MSRRAPNVSAIAIAATLTAASCAPVPPADLAEVDGQWIWSESDRRLFLDSRIRLPGLVPGVWASTIEYEGGELHQHLALPPRFDDGTPVALVVRFDDQLHGVWDDIDDDLEVARLIGARLEVLLGHADRMGPIAEVQLDYDCPVRRLDRWSRVVAHLTAGALADRDVWITSLVAHVRERGYGRRFRDHVAGHMLQVFDTGDQATPATVDEIRALVAGHAMPFRFAVGAFERRLDDGRTTDHIRWFAAARPIAESPWYAGLWVFPAGRPYAGYLEVTG